MKKIKALAILMAMTLTFSMFATAASAVDGIELNSKNGADSSVHCTLTGYTRADFQSNLNNAKYAAFIDFEFTAPTTKTEVTANDEYSLSTPMVGAEGVNCVFVLKRGDTDGKIFLQETTGSGKSTTVASGTGAMRIDTLTNVNISLDEVLVGDKVLKPVAVGYFITAIPNNSTTNYGSGATITLSDNTTVSQPCGFDNATAASKGKQLHFFGYKAPIGKSLKSINVSNENGATQMRVDDLCVIYEEASKIEAGVRFSKDEAGYVEFTTLNQVIDDTEADGITVNVSDDYNGKRVILTGYDSNNNLVFVNSNSTSENPLKLGAGMNSTRKGRTKMVKAFVWDKDTLVPVGAAASLEYTATVVE